jgi:hypothetical protein
MGELKTIKREDRQDQKQTQHAEANGASQRQKEFLLKPSEADIRIYCRRGHVEAITRAASNGLCR